MGAFVTSEKHSNMEAHDTQTKNGPDFSSLSDFVGQDTARTRNMFIGVVHAVS
jgi:hypothetical protein